MREVSAAPEVEFLDAAAGTGIDEELPQPPRPARRRRRWWVLGLVAVAVAVLAGRGVLDRPAPPPAAADTATVPVLGPGGVYEQVPYVPNPDGNAADAGHLQRCAPGWSCIVRRDLPASTLTALRAVFPGLRIQAAWTVVVQRPGAMSVQSRQVFGVIGSHTIEADVRPIVASDTSVRFHLATVEGTRSVWATASAGTYVWVSAFERYESTGGVLDRLGTLVRGGTLLAVQ